MAGSFEASQTQGNVIVRFEYEGAISKAQILVDRITKFIIRASRPEPDSVPIVFEELSWQDELDLIDWFVISNLRVWEQSRSFMRKKLRKTRLCKQH